jgi:hypothetical protein
LTSVTRRSDRHHFPQAHAAVKPQADERPSVHVLACARNLEPLRTAGVVLSLVPGDRHGHGQIFPISKAVVLLSIPAGGPLVSLKLRNKRNVFDAALDRSNYLRLVFGAFTELSDQVVAGNFIPVQHSNPVVNPSGIAGAI